MSQKTATRPKRLRTHVMLTMTDEQREKIEAIAEAEERSMTSVCRLLVIDALARREAAARRKGVRQ